MRWVAGTGEGAVCRKGGLLLSSSSTHAEPGRERREGDEEGDAEAETEPEAELEVRVAA